MLSNRFISELGPPRGGVHSQLLSVMPSDLRRLLEEANGFVAHGGAFRCFGWGNSSCCRDAEVWHSSGWRAYTPGIPVGFVAWGEDVFGNQFVVDPGSGKPYVFNVESAVLRPLGATSVTAAITTGLLVESPELVDLELVAACGAAGLTAGIQEHLAYEVPLMCGGEQDTSNMEVVDAYDHLAMLGQIIMELRQLPDGVPVGAFESGD